MLDHFLPRALAIAVGACVLLAPVAQGADEGVVVDPSSASGKEYAIPVDSARDEASGSATPRPKAQSTPAPIFGVGVKRAPAKTTTAPAAARPATMTRKQAPATTSSAKTRPVATTATAPSARTSVARTPVRAVPAGREGNGGGGIVAAAGVALAVLVLGSFLALAIRRRVSTA